MQSLRTTPQDARPASPPARPAGPECLTWEEIVLCQRLSECWDDFLRLARPRARADDRRAFLAAVQDLQRIVMSRGPRRIHPDVFRP